MGQDTRINKRTFTHKRLIDMFRTEKSQLILNWVGWLFTLVIASKDYCHLKV